MPDDIITYPELEWGSEDVGTRRIHYGGREYVLEDLNSGQDGDVLTMTFVPYDPVGAERRRINRRATARSDALARLFMEVIDEALPPTDRYPLATRLVRAAMGWLDEAMDDPFDTEPF